MQFFNNNVTLQIIEPLRTKEILYPLVVVVIVQKYAGRGVNWIKIHQLIWGFSSGALV